jgi:hypothetical protein
MKYAGCSAFPTARIFIVVLNKSTIARRANFEKGNFKVAGIHGQ